jgi:hypothetical protein
MQEPVSTEFRMMYMIIGAVMAVAIWFLFSSGKPVSLSVSTTSPSITTQYVQKDPIMDFYHPPEKQISWWSRILNPYRAYEIGHIQPYNMKLAQVPINIHTRGIIDEYQQVGILTGNDLAGAPTISPLMGRRSPSGNSRWQYYTMFNGSGSAIPVKLPITAKGKGCSEDRGCEELQTGDEVAAEGYGANFKVTVYPDKKLYYL